MPTIKDVARRAGVSVSTVSIVINGKAAERSISTATQQRVHEAMDSLAYRPNVSARRLRLRDAAVPMVAFFWPLDFRVSILASLLNAFAMESRKADLPCEFTVQTYDNDRLDHFDRSLLKGDYSAVVMGGASRGDVEHLEQLDLMVPTILLNRSSQRYSTVSVDNEAIGDVVASAVAEAHAPGVSILSGSADYVAGSLRVRAFVAACRRLGVTVDSRFTLRGDSTMRGGYVLAKRLVSLEGHPTTVFCDSDEMAFGALRAFGESGIAVPDDLGIIAIDMTGSGIVEYASPSLTAVDMPNREVGRRVISILGKTLGRSGTEPIHELLMPELVTRESF